MTKTVACIVLWVVSLVVAIVGIWGIATGKQTSRLLVMEELTAVVLNVTMVDVLPTVGITRWGEYCNHSNYVWNVTVGIITFKENYQTQNPPRMLCLPQETAWCCAGPCELIYQSPVNYSTCWPLTTAGALPSVTNNQVLTVYADESSDKVFLVPRFTTHWNGGIEFGLIWAIASASVGLLLTSFWLVAVYRDQKVTTETATEIVVSPEAVDISVDNADLCPACYTRKRNVLLRPCNHLYYCTICATKAGQGNDIPLFCPLCRAIAEEKIIVFLA